MPASVNYVELIGNLGADPEIRAFQNGGRVANFTVATGEKWLDKKSGEVKEATDWHRISVTNEGIIKTLEKYVKKGSLVRLTGQMKTRRYVDKDGVEKYTTEVLVRPFRGDLTILSWPADKAEPVDDANLPEGEF